MIKKKNNLVYFSKHLLSANICQVFPQGYKDEFGVVFEEDMRNLYSGKISPTGNQIVLVFDKM